MIPLILWLLLIPGVFLVLPLLSVATGFVCARRMTSISHVFGLLTGCACGIVAGYLMLYRADALRWTEGQFGVAVYGAIFLVLTVVIAVAGIAATWGICRVRHATRGTTT